MTKALIKLAYRQVFDVASKGLFELKVFHDSYAEFLMKIQAYNQEGRFTRFSEIVANDGRANSLHYKTSFSVMHHIESLGKKIPGLQDTAGRLNIPFITPEFKVLESDIADKSLHSVAIIYHTDILTLLDSFGEYLLLGMGDQSENNTRDGIETFVLKMQPELSITFYKSAQKQPDFSTTLSEIKMQ